MEMVVDMGIRGEIGGVRGSGVGWVLGRKREG